MHVVFVHVHVKEEYLNEFINETMENARNSSQEPGIVRFDFFQKADEPTRFVLVEIYKEEADQLKHRETDHYKKWRDNVTEMMAGNRVGLKYKNLFPEDDRWK